MTATISHTRLRVLFAFFTVASLLLSARLAYWQTVGRGDLLSRATDQVHSDLAVAAQRGIIRDRTGAILATTVELRSLYAIPAQMKDSEGHDTRPGVAAALAPILGERPEVLRAAFDSGAEWLFVGRRLPEETAARIAALGLSGLGFEMEPKRLYPNGAVGAQVLGFVNDDGLGQYGVEGSYDDALAGTPGRLAVARDPANRELALGLRAAVPAKNGDDLWLTVDLAVQNAAERERAAVVEREKAAGGAIVGLDPKDGAVFVASKLGAADLNAYLHAFGFGARTGVDLAAETAGIVRPLAEWSPVDLGTISLGQGLSVTPLQLASAYAAIANGGILYRPSVVANRRDADGEHPTAPGAVRRGISEKTAATMVTMLTTTGDNRNANAAAPHGHSRAGKARPAPNPS